MTQEPDWKTAFLASLAEANRLDGTMKNVKRFVERCEEIRNGTPNAFYAHVDAFCKELR